MSQLSIVDQPLGALYPRATNPRTHSKKQICQIADSIKRFGFTNPVLIDDANGIIAGHGRLEAAKTLSLTTVPTVRLSNMTEAEIRAYVMADNRLAENAGWDRNLLGLELQYLSELDIDLDLTITGFDLPEIDILIGDLAPAANDNDLIPEISADPPVTQPGDIWSIGTHRLICGDSRSIDTFQKLMGDERAQMVFTDPPYNVRIDGNVCGLGAVAHREFAMASGEMSQAEFTDFLTEIFKHLAAFSEVGSIHFQCMDWRHIAEITAAGQAAYTELKNVCVWAKTNGGMGSLYRSQHELVFVFKSGTAQHINNIELGKHGRNRTNVWSYAGINTFGQGRDDLKLHPTVKPVALVADAIRDCSHRKGIVLDAFAGSGTTLVAADQVGRRSYGIELDPAYCDVIVQRMKTVCGLEAKLLGTDRTFTEVQESRSVAAPALEKGATHG